MESRSYSIEFRVLRLFKIRTSSKIFYSHTVGYLALLYPPLHVLTIQLFHSKIKKDDISQRCV